MQVDFVQSRQAGFVRCCPKILIRIIIQNNFYSYISHQITQGGKIKIAICDDEAFFRKDLIKHLDIYFQARRMCCVYFEFTDGIEILNSKTNFDLIFMDCQMKNTNGLTSALKLREYDIDTKIIFISSFTEIVFDVFSVKAFRFLTKPIDDKRLIEALDSFIEGHL